MKVEKMADTKTTSNDAQRNDAGLSVRERISAVDPLILAVGAAAAGAAVGALLPRSDAEARLLAPVGKQLTATAGTLATVARQTLSAELAGVPVVGQLAVDQVDRVIDAVVEPATAVSVEDPAGSAD